MSNSGFLHLPDNTNTELGRLKKINSSIDLPPSYREIYNTDIVVENIDVLDFASSKVDGSAPANNKVIIENQETLNKYNETADINGTQSIANTDFGNMSSESSLDNSGTNNKKNSDVPPRKNMLHDYAPYNYNISLSALSKEAFNSGGFIGEEVLILKSGGKGDQNTISDKDLYVNNLIIRHTLAPTKHGRSATVYQILFDVVEPYGTTFIDILIKAAKSLGYKNHLKCVYNLKVEFKGVDDEGQPSDDIPYTTRFIPIHINAVDMEIDAGSTYYTIQSTPATNLGLSDLHGKTKETITVTGKTVGEVIENFFQKWSEALKTLQNQGKAKILDEYKLDIEQSTTILNSSLGYGEYSSGDGVVQVSNLQGFPFLSKEKESVNNTRQFSVPAGTKVQTFVEVVVKDSLYYRNQFDDSMNPKDKNGYINTLRTFTQLEIGSLDNQSGRPQYIFKYILREQKISASYFSKTPRDLVTNVNPVRTYNYIFTGENQDVLDFRLSYNFGYYYPISYSKPTGKDLQTGGGKGILQTEEDNQDTVNKASKGSIAVSSEAINETDTSFLPGQNAKNDQAMTLIEQIIEDPAADLIAVDMEILGDPGFIEQKSVTNRKMTDSFVEDSPGIDLQGAVTPDEYECYVNVNFKVPTDLNDESGLFDKINSKDTAFFRGIYKVYHCEHRFDSGVYSTLLTMVRMRYQNQDDKSESENTNTNGTTPVQQSAGSSKAGLQGKQGFSYDTTRPSFLSGLSSGAGESLAGIEVSNNSTTSNVDMGFDPSGFTLTTETGVAPAEIDLTGGTVFFESPSQIAYRKDGMLYTISKATGELLDAQPEKKGRLQKGQ